MNRVILIKYGELTTKKGNRNFFINTLYQMLLKKLKDFDVKVSKDISRMYIEFNDSEITAILNRINHIFGIHTYQVAVKVETKEDVINQAVIDYVSLRDFKTFKVEVKRSDKKFPISSMDYAKKLGGIVLKNKDNISVDVHNPDMLLKLEILERYTYIYSDTYMGLGGYPVGTQPRSMLMLSGGIDSPVAGYLAMKRGVKIDAVYFEAIPHTSIEARNKVIDLTRKLAVYTDKISLHVINFTEIQEAIYKNCNGDYTITIMRRMMYRIMERLAKRYKALAIVNGESIGQVASQTLVSMSVINEVTNMPVIRPVACLDKLEIIDIAKKIDTYDISILPYEDCCTVFVPKHPVINPRFDECLINEEKFDYNAMINNIMDNIETITITESDDEFNKFL